MSRLSDVASMRCIACGGPAFLVDNQRLIDGYDKVHADLAASQAEAAKLREALEVILKWDSLNPPAPGTDFPWLKTVVDEALENAK